MKRTDYTILHCADLHLASPLRGLEAHHDAPRARIRDATQQAFTNIVDLAIAESVALVLIAGDIYDGNHRDTRASTFFIAALKRLVDHGIHVVAISGNHDAESVLVDDLKTRWPSSGQVAARMLRTDEAETIVFEDLNLVVHGRGFPTRSVSKEFIQSYPTVRPGMFNIGLLHTSAGGSSDHDEYAACDPKTMAAFGYDYWALGHVHTRSAEKIGECWIVFPGNPQGRHIRETGEKGVTLIDVKQGRIHAKPRHHTLDVVRWALIEADVSAAPDLDAALATIRGAIASALAVSAPRLLAARLRIGGATQAHAALFAAHDLRDRIMGEAIAAGGADLFWLEKLALNTTPATERVAATPLEILLHERLAAPPSDAVLQDVRKWARDVLEKYPPLKAALSDSIDAHPALALTQHVPQGAELDAIIEEARALVFARLGA